MSRHSICSGLDVNDNKLVLLLPEEIEESLKTDLQGEVMSLGMEPFEDVFTTQSIKGTTNISDLNATTDCNPGCQICYFDSSEVLRYASCGAFLKDQDDKVYVLSSCHGHSAHDFYLMESATSAPTRRRHKLKRVAGVHQKDPLLDAVLLEVTDHTLLKKCIPQMSKPSKNVTPMEVFTGPTEELAGSDSKMLGRGKKVVKYGGMAQKTSGELFLYDFRKPSEEITNALVIIPGSSDDTFCSEGDSGSVIFRGESQKNKKVRKGEKFPHHEGIAVLCSGLGDQEMGFWGLAFRLDDAIEFFEAKLNKEFSLLPFNY